MSHFNARRTLALGAIATLALATPVRANLLTNGSFESNTAGIAVGTSLTNSSTQYLTGWTFQTPSASDVVRTPFAAYSQYPSAATDGEYYVGINWSNFLGVLDNTLSQQFTLGAGSTGLNLSFDMSTEAGSALSSLTVLIQDSTGTSTLLSSAAFHNTQGNAQWDSKTYSATLAPGTYTLALHAVTDSTAYDVLVDNMNLTAILGDTVDAPEPASAALLAGALLLTAAWRRRTT